MDLNNAVKISNDNLSIERIIEKCINCGMCKNTCKVKEGMSFDENSELCINCGQCVQSCPVRALIPKRDYEKFKDAKKKGKICIAYTSPSVRVALGDAFDKEYGSFEQNKVVGVLRKLGFDYVFDTTFAADLTIMEEANELIERIKNKETLPMFTSCCPAWIKYAEQFYPEVLDNISTCKSPIGMMGPTVKEYFCNKEGIDKENTFTVAITPCTAKKYEISRPEITGTDLVITISEIIDEIQKLNLNYDDIEESDYDSFFKEGSGAGVIFGNTGGVMEAALRTAYYILTNENLKEINFNEVRGNKAVKEATIKINNLSINVAVVNGIINAIPLIEDVKNGNSKYQYIEIMNCVGGCIGGGGMPKINQFKQEQIISKRIEGLYKEDDNLKNRFSHENEDIKRTYDEFYGKPLSKKSHTLLHTTYTNRKNIISNVEKESI